MDPLVWLHREKKLTKLSCFDQGCATPEYGGGDTSDDGQGDGPGKRQCRTVYRSGQFSYVGPLDAIDEVSTIIKVDVIVWLPRAGREIISM